METYAVSRATVRRAIEQLVAEGVLRRVQGKGTFVAPPRVQSHLHLASFTQDMRRRGKAPTTRVVRVEAVRTAGGRRRLVRARARGHGLAGRARPTRGR